MIRKYLKKILSYVLSWPFIPSYFYYFGFNGRVAIEPTNSCNLQCRLCPTWQAQTRARGLMPYDDFVKIIDENQDIFKKINMIFAGEPLLNKDVFKMVKYAEDRKIETLLSSNTTLFNDNNIKELFDSGLSQLIVCLDGATKQTHEQYRQGSDFDKVKENIRKICQEKKIRSASKLYITLQFLVMKQNESEIPEIIKLAEGLGVDALNLKTISLGSFNDVQKKIKLAQENLPTDEKYSRFTFKDGVLKEKFKPRFCSWIRQTLIYWNGDVSVCCYDINGEMVVGNIFKDGGFKKILKGVKYRRFRKNVIQKKFRLCQNCNFTGETSHEIIFNKP